MKALVYALILFCSHSVLSLPNRNGATLTNVTEKLPEFTDCRVKFAFDGIKEVKTLLERKNGRDFINDVSNKFIGSTKEILNIVNCTYQRARAAEEAVEKKTEEFLAQLTEGLEETKELYRNYAEPALRTMLNAKIQMKAQRNKLNEVAQRVKYTVKDLKAIAKSIFAGEITGDENINEIIEHQVALVSELITKTEKIIGDAHELYNNIKKTFAQVQLNLKAYKKAIQNILDSTQNTSNDRDTVIAASRASVYSACAFSTPICIAVDALGLVGICSAINLGVCGTMIAAMETSIAVTDPYYETLLERADRAFTIASEVLENQTLLEEYLRKETYTLGEWSATLSGAKSNLNLSKTVFKTNIPTLRKRYIEALEDLEKGAQKYLDQEELKTTRVSIDQKI